MLFLLRAGYLWIHFLLVCSYSLIFCLLFPRRLNNTTQLATKMSWSLPVCNIRFIQNNHVPLPSTQSAVYVFNHQDSLDVMICTSMLPKNIAVLGKSSLRWIPIFGLAFWLAGNIFINRTDKSKAWDVMRKTTALLKERGNSLFIAPEGTRSNGKGLLPFKTGAFNLAIAAGIPIVPLVFSSTHKNIDLNRWKAGIAIGEYLEPIPTEHLKPEDIRDLMQLTHQRMQDALERLDRQASQAAVLK